MEAEAFHFNHCGVAQCYGHSGWRRCGAEDGTCPAMRLHWPVLLLCVGFWARPCCIGVASAACGSFASSRWPAGRSEKCIFLLKFLLKRAHFGASVWGVSSGWPGGRLEKCIFLLNFLLKRAHFEASVWGGSSGWPAGRLEKCIFLLKFLLKRAHFGASVWGGSSGWQGSSN